MIEGFKITKSSEVYSGLVKHMKTYNDRGKYLGWDKLHEHYSMALGSCTDWTGYPRSGKTQVLMECLLNTSLWYDWKHLVYFPDVGSNIEIIADLIQKKTGKSFNPTSKNVILEKDIAKEVDWITHHFLILTKVEIKAKMTPYQFWDYAVKLKKEREGNLQTASIDSWKDMKHETSAFAREDKYLEDVLSYRNSIAEANDIHLHTIIHPKLTDKGRDGKRKPPTPYDMKGGSEWINSGKCMVTVHREDLTDNRAEIIFHKIKPRALGKVGSIEFRFDLDLFKYYELSVPEANKHVKSFAAERGKTNIIVVGSVITDQQALDLEEPKKDDDLPF